MISLVRHIELLLLEHDCVIVPGLGGFIANHADARYTGSDEQLFLPPYRTIGFNQQLQVNDGLLVQSYMNAYDTSYPAANLQMEKDLEKMMYELEMKGEYELENLGTLKKGLNQNITFTAQETGALTPSLYGLYSYEMKSLKYVIKEKDIQRTLQAAANMHIANHDAPEQETENISKRKDVVIHLNRRWLDFGISAAAAVLLFFCFSYLAMKGVNNSSDTLVASFPTMEKVSSTTQKPTVNSTTVANPKSTKPAATQTKPEKAEKIEPTNKTTYTIVLATYVSQDNAERYIKVLAKDGFDQARYVKNGKVSRILYSNYNDELAAQQALISLRQKSAEFAEAWILEEEAYETSKMSKM